MKKKSRELGYLKLSAWGMRFLWQTSRKNTLGYIICIILQITAEVIQLWVASMVVNEVAKIVTSHVSIGHVLVLAAIMIGLMMIDKVAWQLLGYFERQVYLEGSGNIYLKFNQKMAELSVAQHHHPEIRKLMDRLEYEGYFYKPLNFSFELLYAMHAGLRFITSSIIIMQQLPFVVLMLVVGTLPVLYIQRKSGDKGWGIWGDIGDSSRVFWGISSLLRNKEAVEEMTPQRSKPFLLSQASSAIVQYTTKAMRIRRQYTLYEIGAGLFEMIMAGASYLWLVFRAVSGFVTFGSFVFLSSLIWQTLSSVRLVTQSIAKMLENVPFMRDFVKFTSLENDLPVAENSHVITADDTLSIEFRHVSFKYPRQKGYSLQDISLTITPGEHLALVGLNGAGKTTLIRLLLRFYDPTEGAIYVNGVDLREIDLDSYYQHVGTLFQVFNRYPLSFEANVTLSNKKSRDKYEHALDVSGADAVLKKLANEHVPLSPDFEHGVDLSGGQWQRVAIARNMYAGGEMFILDEPTSAIDALAEQQIFEKLYRELQGKILITVSHRFNTVRKANTIIVLEQGRIVEKGSHAELMKNTGQYHDMFTTQAEGYAF